LSKCSFKFQLTVVKTNTFKLL